MSCRVTTTWIQSLCGRGDTQLGRSLGEVQGQNLSEDPGPWLHSSFKASFVFAIFGGECLFDGITTMHGSWYTKHVQIADKLQATFTPPVATQGYPHLKQRYWWWPTQWAAAKAAAAARNKQQGAPARNKQQNLAIRGGGPRRPAPPPRVRTPPQPPPKPKSVVEGAKSKNAAKQVATPQVAASG